MVEPGLEASLSDSSGMLLTAAWHGKKELPDQRLQMIKDKEMISRGPLNHSLWELREEKKEHTKSGNELLKTREKKKLLFIKCLWSIYNAWGNFLVALRDSEVDALDLKMIT